MTRRTAQSNLSLSACVKPLYGNVSALSLWEFIRYYELMGVELFTLYVTPSAAQSAVELLLRLRDRPNAPSIISLQRWNLPLLSNRQVHTQGIIGALNDCLRRRRLDTRITIEGNRTIFVKFCFRASQMLRRTSLFSIPLITRRIRSRTAVDYDEFIVVHRRLWANRTLADIFDDQFAQRPNAGALLIRSAFFWREWESGYNSSDSGLVLVDKTWRSSHIFPSRRRSKLAFWTKDVEVLGNHFIWRFKKRMNARNVQVTMDWHDLLLHHYRTMRDHAFYRPDKEQPVQDTFARAGGLRLLNEIASPAVKCLNFTV